MALSKQKKCKDAQHPSCSTHRPQPARACSYPPVHRESLVTPQHTFIVPRGYNSRRSMDIPNTRHASAWANELGRRASQSGGNQEDDAATFQDWLSPFCQEPPGADPETCCMGFWVPCALYGRTAWRLTSLTYEEDDNRRRWTPANGCNGQCWTWCAVAFWLSPCFAGLLTGVQRTRIRGIYGIKGTVASDGAAGFFCPWCTQIQNDREVRAREGEERFRYNRKYVASHAEIINTQPTAQSPMTYVPPMPDTISRSHSPPRSYTPSRPGSEPRIEMAHLTKAKKLQKGRPVVEFDIQIDAPQSTPSQDDASSRQVKEQQRDKQEKNKDIKEKSKEKSADSDTKKNEQGAKVSRKDRRKASLHTSAQSGLSGAKASSKVTNSSSSAAVQSVSAARDRSDHARLSQEHDISDCVGAGKENTSKEKSELKTHDLAHCPIVDSGDKITTPSVEQHRLSDDSGASSRREDVQQLSYVHDFADCPIDKNVLDYYENQSKGARQHSLNDEPRASFATFERKRLSQHSLTDDSRVSMSSSYGRSHQHNLSKDPRASSSSAPVQQHGLSYDSRMSIHYPPAQQHDLHDDSRASIFVSPAHQHRLSDDPRASSSTIHYSQGTPDQHTEAECLDLYQAHSNKLVGDNKRSTSYASDTTVTKDTAGLREHRLASCPPGLSVDTSSEDHSDDSQKRARKRLLLFPKIKEISQRGHVHDENCLKDGSHHRCAMDFDKTISDGDNTNRVGEESKDRDPPKQRHSKGIRKTRSKITTGSHDSKSGQSAEKSVKSAKNNASSCKENFQSTSDIVANELIGFPYNDITETKIMGAGKKAVFIATTEKNGAASKEERASQEGTSSSIWSKITGGGKGKEKSEESHV